MAQLGIYVSVFHKVAVRCWLGLWSSEDLFEAGESAFKVALLHVQWIGTGCWPHGPLHGMA